MEPINAIKKNVISKYTSNSFQMIKNYHLLIVHSNSFQV